MPGRTDALRVEPVAGTGSWEGLREEWEALRAASGAGIFLSWEWMATWWQHYGTGHALCLLAVRDAAGGLVGVAPLVRRVRRYRGVPLRVVELLGTGGEVSPDLLDILARPDRAAAVGRAVWAHLAEQPSWDVLVLDSLAVEAAAAGALAEAAGHDGMAWGREPRSSCPFIKLPKTWEAYLACRAAATRYDVGRKARALCRGHDVKLERADDAPDLGLAMETLFNLHAARWRLRGDPGSFDRDPRNRPFHRAMAVAAQRRGWLRLHFLNVDGRRVAGFLGYEVDGRLSYYQLGWEPAWARWSVGTVLIAEVLRDAIARGVNEFDFLRAAERYKIRLADAVRQTTTLRVWAPTARGRLHQAMHAAARWAHRARTLRPGSDGRVRGHAEGSVSAAAYGSAGTEEAVPWFDVVL